MSAVWLCILCAVASYLVGGVNPAIVLSKAVYHQDIRALGSGNPGFTNFKRVFGGRWAWVVFALDILKGVIPCVLFGALFRRVTGYYHLGAAYTGFFGMLGHAFPVWYRFRGGKGFLVGAAAIWFVDWRAGLVALCIMALLLFTKRYMSLSVICAAISCPVTLLIVGVEHPAVWWLCLASVALLVWRHSGNIRRLREGTEPKFYLGKR